MTEDNAFSQLCRPVRRLIQKKGFETPTEPQTKLIPLILQGKDVLLISATATGKTEAAALPVLHQFLMKGGRQPGISILYITPLRALNRDILDRMTYWANRLDIRLSVRHGDTSQKERNYQRRSPPDMLITTPETLQAILQGRTIKNHLKTVRWIIIDEIHELADNKRGSQLSLALERVKNIAEEQPQLIGLSATIGTPDKVARFLGGEDREVEIVQVSALRDTRFEIVYPKPGPEHYELSNRLFTHPEVAVRLKVMKDLIDEHDTTLIFTNTRSTSEALTSRFNIWDTEYPLSIHHGSLAKTSRIATEHGLRSGDIRTVICTSSLELGIDIGRIDLVIQYNSPRQVTRLLQRVGRSGHSIDQTSKGVIIAMNSDDALESMVICRRALKEMMEPLKVPEKPYDVLVNQMIAELMQTNRMYILQYSNLFTNAYPYRNLTEQEIADAANYMHDRFPRLAWFSPEDEVIIKPRGSRKTMYRYFFNNLSMIPDEKDYLIIDVDGDDPVGILQEAFVAEYAKPGVKFTLRGRAWKILNIHTDKIYVRAEDDPTGAIPSWVGEQIPVPFEVAMEVGEIKGIVEEHLNNGETPDSVARELCQRYAAKPETMKRVIKELVDHQQEGYIVPTDKRVVVEDWDDNVIIHANFGSLANRTLARIVGHVISEATGYPVGVQQDTYMIITQTVGEVDARYVANKLKTLAKKDLTEVIEEAVTKTGLFKKRIINVARKSGALSKFANFSNITLGRLMKSFEGTVIYEEAMKDTLRQDLDVDTTLELLSKMARGDIEVSILDTQGEVSPLGQLGVDSISMKVDIVPPEKITKIIIESAKARLYNETRTLTCLGKHDWLQEMQVDDFLDKIECPICGSTEIAVLDRTMEEVAEMMARTKGRYSFDPPWWWKEAEDKSKLVSIHGRRGGIVAAAKRVENEAAWDILAETEGEGDEFFERIVEAEREALKKRFM
ncbi:DEAD/DEAH box helicase [Candidatus Bathyarchaeota archaeon]|nr:DEAD/DEAH box helicase [Candidatus Bathyarchaeota archaeon]